MLLKKIIDKTKEENGADGTIEMSAILIILMVILIAIVGFSHLIYTNFKVMQFANESVRIAELTGEVGEKTYEQIEKLKKAVGIEPIVEFNKEGKINFLENVSVTVELPYKLKIPFLEIKVKIIKSATGTGEVYYKYGSDEN